MAIKQLPVVASVLKKMQPWKHLYSSKCSVLHQRWTQSKDSNLAVIFYELWVQEVIEYEIAIFWSCLSKQKRPTGEAIWVREIELRLIYN